MNVKNLSTMSSFGCRPPAGRVGPPGEQGPLDLEIAVLGERLRDVDHEEVGQQELGQRVIARPFAGQSVLPSQPS